MEHCRLSLARYKVPRAVYVEETLPKNAVGKSPSQCFANACGSRIQRSECTPESLSVQSAQHSTPHQI